MKRCSCCKVEKPLSAFCKNKARSGGLNCDCRICAARYRKNWYERNIERERGKSKKWHKHHKPGSIAKHNKTNYHLMETFGITLGQYDKLFENQNGVCAICGKPEKAKSKYGFVRRLAVDHNHKTGKIRSLLCGTCNQDLGVYENRKKEFENYLRSFK